MEDVDFHKQENLSLGKENIFYCENTQAEFDPHNFG